MKFRPVTAFLREHALKYDNGNLTAEWAHQLVGAGYNAEVGYVQKNRLQKLRTLSLGILSILSI